MRDAVSRAMLAHRALIDRALSVIAAIERHGAWNQQRAGCIDLAGKRCACTCRRSRSIASSAGSFAKLNASEPMGNSTHQRERRDLEAGSRPVITIETHEHDVL